MEKIKEITIYILSLKAAHYRFNSRLLYSLVVKVLHEVLDYDMDTVLSLKDFLVFLNDLEALDVLEYIGKNRYLPIREANLDLFDAQQIKAMDSIIGNFK